MLHIGNLKVSCGVLTWLGANFVFMHMKTHVDVGSANGFPPSHWYTGVGNMTTSNTHLNNLSLMPLLHYFYVRDVVVFTPLHVFDSKSHQLLYRLGFLHNIHDVLLSK